MAIADTALSRFEYHDYFSDEGRTVVTTTFVFQVVNMGVLVVLVGSSFIPSSLAGFNMGAGSLEFDRKWYTSAGTHLAQVLVVQFVLSQVVSMFSWLLWKPLRRLMNAKHADSQVRAAWGVRSVCRGFTRLRRCDGQVTLNKLYSAPQFDVARRYSSLLAVVFVSMAYSPAVPALVPLAMVGLCLRYWVDKVALLRLLAKPKQDLVPLAKVATSILPWAVVASLCVGVWAFSASDVFTDPTVFGISTLDKCADQSGCASFVGEHGGAKGIGRLMPANVLPLVVMLVLTVVGLTVGWPVRSRTCTLRPAVHAQRDLFACVLCCAVVRHNCQGCLLLLPPAKCVPGNSGVTVQAVTALHRVVEAAVGCRTGRQASSHTGWRNRRR